MEKNWSWIDEEKRVCRGLGDRLKQRAIGMLQAAGLAYDPARSWSDHVAELAAAARTAARHSLLVEQLIPQAEKQLRPAQEIAQLESQQKMIEAEGGPPPPMHRSHGRRSRSSTSRSAFTLRWDHVAEAPRRSSPALGSDRGQASAHVLVQMLGQRRVRVASATFEMVSRAHLDRTP